MKLDIFANTAIKIVSSAFAALTIFAFVAGQSASAGTFTKDVDHHAVIAETSVDERFSRAVELVTELEQNLMDAKAQMLAIETGFEKGEFDQEDLFIATVMYFNIESAVVDARVQLMVTMSDLQKEQYNATDNIRVQPRFALAERHNF